LATKIRAVTEPTDSPRSAASANLGYFKLNERFFVDRRMIAMSTFHIIFAIFNY